MRALLVCAILFLPSPQTAPKPALENDRVAVWDVTGSATAQPFDAVVVAFSGSASFLPKGTVPKIAERSFVINLKDHPVAPIANTSGYPFPRPGSRLIFENARVIVWDCTWTLGAATPVHFHDKDIVAVFLEEGDLKSTAPDGKETVNLHTSGTVTYAARDRSHYETLVRGKQRAIVTELK